uniref:Uncharacterized protein n=1 Tax=Sinocyclocheilus grahami TaxID=75366 RepID=A0A672L2C3_SINGR
MMSVCVPSPRNSSPSVDVANCNGPSATPPSSLSLHSSHNQLLSGDVIKQGQATPPKCRKKYALTSIQSAMGLSEGVTPPSSSSATTKLAKNGVNQLRKAADESNSPEHIKTKSYLESCLDDLSNELSDTQDENVTKPLLEKEKNPCPSSPRKPHSPEDTPLLSIGSSSSSSSPETKKDRPRTGAKTDRALNRIQNLPHSDEESSWTTLSQDSASLGSPEESGHSIIPPKIQILSSFTLSDVIPNPVRCEPQNKKSYRMSMLLFSI